MRRRVHLVALAVTSGFALAGGTSLALAQCEELAELTASDAGAWDNFGNSVAVSGPTAVVGAWRYGGDRGSAYVFRYDGSSRVHEAQLLAADGSLDDRFGKSVAISGDTAVIGATGDDDNGRDSGSVYVFRFDGLAWVEAAKLLASDGRSYDYFGCSVGVSDDTAVIGAWEDDDNGSVSGSAYVFRFDGSSWVQEAKLRSSDGAAYDQFGYSVAIAGDIALIGAMGDGNENGHYAGSAYVFRHDGSSWVEEAKLLASDPDVVSSSFGKSVSISAHSALIGAGNNESGTAAGVAYVFRYDGSAWLQEAKLLASDGRADDRLGESVAVSGDTAVIGAFNSGNTRPGEFDGHGSAYVFRYNGSTWVEEANSTAQSYSPSTTWFGRHRLLISTEFLASFWCG